MPIGKDSITKRVARVDNTKAEASEKEQNIAPELVATTAAAPKKAPAKNASSTAKGTVKKPSTKKAPATTDAKVNDTASAEVATNVLSNVAPETVEAVIGHKEDAKYEKVSIGDDMPEFLL